MHDHQLSSSLVSKHCPFILLFPIINCWSNLWYIKGVIEISLENGPENFGSLFSHNLLHVTLEMLLDFLTSGILISSSAKWQPLGNGYPTMKTTENKINTAFEDDKSHFLWLTVIQQSQVWVYFHRNWNQDLKETLFTPMLITTLLTTDKICKQPKCPPTDKWIKKMWYILTMEGYATFKKKKILPYTTIWMNM